MVDAADARPVRKFTRQLMYFLVGDQEESAQRRSSHTSRASRVSETSRRVECFVFAGDESSTGETRIKMRNLLIASNLLFRYVVHGENFVENITIGSFSRRVRISHFAEIHCPFLYAIYILASEICFLSIFSEIYYVL